MLTAILQIMYHYRINRAHRDGILSYSTAEICGNYDDRSGRTINSVRNRSGQDQLISSDEPQGAFVDKKHPECQ